MTDDNRSGDADEEPREKQQQSGSGGQRGQIPRLDEASKGNANKQHHCKMCFSSQLASPPVSPSITVSCPEGLVR